MKKIVNPILFLLTLFVSVGVSAQALTTAGAAAAAWVVAYTGSRLFLSILVDFVGSGPSFCWFCPAISAMFDAMNRMATTISLQLSHVFLALMGVGLLFLIAFKVARVLISLKDVDLIQFLDDLFRPLGRAIVATAFLFFSLSIFNVLVSPILIMSLSFSDMIIEAGGGRGEMITAMRQVQQGASASNSGAVIQINGLCDDLQVVEKIKASASLENQDVAFTEDVRASLICSVRTSSAGLIFGMILGSTIWALAFIDMWMGVIPNFNYIILGGLLLLGHLAIFITFPFKLVDGILRMAFVCALMPLWIILWVFPATVGYTKKAWDMFISTCAIFLCLSVVIVLIMHLMQFAIPNRELLIQYLVKDQLKEAANLIPFSGVNLLLTLMLCFVGFKMLGSATSLASTFTGNMPDLGMGNAMGAAMVQGAKTGSSWVSTGAGKVMDKMGITPEQRQQMKKGATMAALGVFTGGASYVVTGLFDGATNYIGKKFGGGSGPWTTVQQYKNGTTITTEYYDKDKKRKKSRTIRDAMGNERRREYHPSGNISKRSTTRNGTTTSFEYDDNKQLTKHTVTRANGSGFAQEYYDTGATKSRSTWTSSGVKRTFTYFSDGTTQKSFSHDDGNGNTVQYVYDQAGNLTSTDTVQVGQNSGRRLKTHLDNKNNITTESVYDNRGEKEQTKVTDVNGARYYDNDGNLILDDNLTGTQKVTLNGKQYQVLTTNNNTTYFDAQGHQILNPRQQRKIDQQIANIQDKMNI